MPGTSIGQDSVTVGTVPRILSLLLIVLLAACKGPQPAAITLATTTSVVNSNLLAPLVEAYQTEAGIPVHVSAVGSGRALAMLAAGQADVAITHAPAQEREHLHQHDDWAYRKFLYNDFLLVGPATDPAQVGKALNATDAMKRIATARARFISRGDGSGTEERELSLWAAARVGEADRPRVIAGAGMGATLRVASETDAYTLTDRGTWSTIGPTLRLKPLFEGDPSLLNTYAVITPSLGSPGGRFARWIAEGRGHDLIASTLESGRVKGFTLWPADRPGGKPGDLPR